MEREAPAGSGGQRAQIPLNFAQAIGLAGGFQRGELGLEGAPVVGLIDARPDRLDLLIDQLLGFGGREVGMVERVGAQRLKPRKLRPEVLKGIFSVDFPPDTGQGAGLVAAEPVEEEGLPAQGFAAWARLESASVPWLRTPSLRRMAAASSMRYAPANPFSASTSGSGALTREKQPPSWRRFQNTASACRPKL